MWIRKYFHRRPCDRLQSGQLASERGAAAFVWLRLPFYLPAYYATNYYKEQIRGDFCLVAMGTQSNFDVINYIWRNYKYRKNNMTTSVTKHSPPRITAPLSACTLPRCVAVSLSGARRLMSHRGKCDWSACFLQFNRFSFFLFFFCCLYIMGQISTQILIHCSLTVAGNG